MSALTQRSQPRQTEKKAKHLGRGKINWLKILNGVLILAAVTGVFIAASKFPVGQWILDSQDWFKVRPVVGAIVYCVIFVGCALCWVPTSILMIGSGLLFGSVGGSLISSMSCVTSAFLCLLIVRYVAGRRFQERFKKNRYFKTLSVLIEKKGIFIISLLRISPLPFGPANCVYSVIPVRTGPYLVASWLGLIPANIAFSYLGATGGALFLKGEAHSLGNLEIGIMVAGAIALVTILGYVGKMVAKMLQSKDPN